MHVETISETLRRYLDAMGRQDIQLPVEIPDADLAAALFEVDSQHPEESQEERGARAIARMICKTYPLPSQREIPIGQAVPLVVVIETQTEKVAKWVWRTAILLALLFLCAKSAHCQLDGLQIQNSVGTSVKQWAGGIAKIKCGANLTCSLASGVVTFTAGAGASVSWDAITAPIANLSISHVAFTTTFTWNAATGAGINLFNLTDTLNNTGTGFMFNVNLASGSALKPAQFAVNGNGVTVSNAGLLAKVGTGGLDYGSLLSFPAACGANLFATQIAATPGCTQPSFSNLSGTAAKGQLPGTTVYTDQANTFGAFLNKFQAGSIFQFLDPTDVTKIVVFDLQNIATATTRTINVPNANSTLAQAFTAPANQFLTAMSAQGVHSAAQPAISNLASSTSADLLAVLSDETGTGKAVFHTSPTLVSPQLGTVAAPGTPGAGLLTVYADSTDLRMHDKNASGVVGTTIVADTGAANNFLTAVSAAGVISKAQPAFTNLSGVATKAQLPAATVYTDQANTYGAFAQDFEGASVTRPLRRLAFASFPATCTANREFLERSDPATAGQVVYVCNAAGTGWDLVGDGGAGGANHNFLSATHPDTLAASPVLGDLVTGNATPAWARFAGNITATKKFLSQIGTGAISATPAWEQPDFANLLGTATDAQLAGIISSAVTYYVCPASTTICVFQGDAGTAATPSDSNNGTAKGTPFATPGKAADVLRNKPLKGAIAQVVFSDTALSTPATLCHSPANVIWHTPSFEAEQANPLEGNAAGSSTGFSETFPTAYLDLVGNTTTPANTLFGGNATCSSTVAAKQSAFRFDRTTYRIHGMKFQGYGTQPDATSNRVFASGPVQAHRSVGFHENITCIGDNAGGVGTTCVNGWDHSDMKFGGTHVVTDASWFGVHGNSNGWTTDPQNTATASTSLTYTMNIASPAVPGVLAMDGSQVHIDRLIDSWAGSGTFNAWQAQFNSEIRFNEGYKSTQCQGAECNQPTVNAANMTWYSVIWDSYAEPVVPTNARITAAPSKWFHADVKSTIRPQDDSSLRTAATNPNTEIAGGCVIQRSGATYDNRADCAWGAASPQFAMLSNSGNPIFRVGTAGTGLGSVEVAGNTSGIVSIKPQAAAGTYNFNLPTGAGTSGQPLLSGGGGAAAQTYGPVGLGNVAAGVAPTGTFDFGGSTAIVVPKAAGAAPTAQGSIAYDTTQDATKLGGRGTITGSVPRVLATFVCNSTVCICTGTGCTAGTFTSNCVSGGADASCTNAGTTETNYGANFSIPASFFKASKILRATVIYEFTAAASSGSMRQRMKLGTVVVFDGGAVFDGTSVGPEGHSMSFMLQGTADPGAAVNVESSQIAGTGRATFNLGNGNVVAQPVAIATNAAQTLQFSLQWGTATIGNFVRLRQMVIEELN